MINKITKMVWWIAMWVSQLLTRFPLGAQDMLTAMQIVAWGICKAPTGYGKSGIIFWRIAEQIKNAVAKDSKLVITLSTPLLVLNDQFYKDLIECLNGANLGINCTNCVFVDNSSEEKNHKGIVEGLNVNRWGFNDLKNAIINNAVPQVVICISTHKSYNKFLSNKDGFVLQQMKNMGYTVATYFDECHTIVDGQSTGKASNASTESDNDPIYMDNLKLVADYLYFFSATPALWQAEWFIKNYAGQKPGYNGFVHEVSILNALKEKQILPPEVTFVEVDNNKDITTLADTLETIMASDYRMKYRKILITCMNTDELELLRDELYDNRGIAVAFTSSKHGKNVWTKNSKTGNLSITDFSKEIEAHEGNMVVLHIRQMIAGVDVPAITSVVNRVFDNTAQNVVKMIQTNGRALRVRSCDRRYFANKQEWMATKVNGEVYNIIEKTSFEQDACFLSRFFNLVYNSDRVKVFRLVGKTLAKKKVGPELISQNGPIGQTNTVWSEATYYLFKFLNMFCKTYTNSIKAATTFTEYQEDLFNDATDFINAHTAQSIAQIQQQTIASLREATFVHQDAVVTVAWTKKELEELGIFKS